MRFTVGLGKAGYGDSAGYLEIYADEPSTDLATPAALCVTASNEVTVTRDINDEITDIETADGSIEVNVVSAYEYTLTVKDPLDATVKTFTIKNPDTSTAYNRLHIYEDGGRNQVWQFSYDDQDDEWVLDEGGWDPQVGVGSVDLLRRKVLDEDVIDADEYRKTITEVDPDTSAVMSKVISEYQSFGWGDEMVKQIVDPDGDALTSEWYYYDDQSEDGDNYGKLQMSVDASGHWEYYEYDSDGRLARTVAQLDWNAAPDISEAVDVDTLADDNTSTVYTYVEEDLDDTDAVDEQIVRVVTKVEGTAQHSRYEIDWSAPVSKNGMFCYESWDIDAVEASPEDDESEAELVEFLNDLYADSGYLGHLVMKTWRIAQEDDQQQAQAHAFQVYQTERPDGTMAFYDRSTPGTTVVTSGYPDPEEGDPDAGDIEEGTRTTSAVDASGNAVSTKMERITRASGSWFTESLVLTSDEDDFGRPLEREYYFGDEADAPGSYSPSYTTEMTYGCCGIESQTDRAGLETGYVYDGLGRQIEVEAPTGVVMHTAYDAAGQVIQTQREASDSSSTITLNESTYDLAGRVTSQKDGEDKYTYYVYRTVGEDGGDYDSGTHSERYDEVRVYPHDTDSGPVQVTWTDSHGRVARQWTASTTATWSDQSPPDGSETLTELSRTATIYDWADRPIEVRTYHDLTSLDLDDDGTVGTNYYQSSSEYDVLGRQWKMTDPIGNITINVYDDATGRLVEQWRGTDDTDTGPGDPSGGDMVMVSKSYYDTDGDGTGDPRDFVTRQYHAKAIGTTPSTLSTDYVYTDFDQVWDDTNEQRIVKTMPQADAGPWSYQVYDFQGRLLESLTYENDSGAEGDLLAKTTYQYDGTTGNLSSTWVYNVHPALPDKYLKTTYFYEDAEDGGRQIKTATSGGGFTKTAFDTHGRTLRTVSGALEGNSTDADAFTDDIVLTETAYDYDDVDNVIQTTTYVRHHDATATGLLSDAAAGEARVSYTAMWYDDAHRPTHVADYGTNGGSALTDYDPGIESTQTYSDGPPDPDSSDDVIVTQTSYNDAGYPAIVTDNAGIETRREYDALGRPRKVVENYDDGAPDDDYPDQDRVTTYTYNAAGQIVTQTADLEGSANDQTTRYVYANELTDMGSPVKSNGLLRGIIYPDSSDMVSGNELTGTDHVEMTYYADGSLAMRTDQRGTVLTYTYTLAGARESQSVTTLGDDTDGTIRSITYAYNTLGRLLWLTSHGNVTSDPTDTTDVENQVFTGSDRLGRPSNEYQEHDGAADANTNVVSYGYDDTTSGNELIKGGRLDYITYPNGRKVHWVYDGHSGIDDAVGRVNELAEDDLGSPGDPIVTYNYIGAGRAVIKDYPTPEVKLSYAEGTGDDPYDASGGGGFDRFGRVVNHGWSDYSGTPVDVLRFTHAYDRASNRVNALRNVYRAHGDVYEYDDLHRLVTYKTGMANAAGDDMEYHGTNEWPRGSQRWNYDQLGNVMTKTCNGVVDWEKATYNKANETDDHDLSADTSPYRFRDYFDYTSFASLWDILGNASLSYSNGKLVVDSLDTQTGLFLATVGEDTGPVSPYVTSIWSSSPQTGDFAGMVLGYKDEDDYWMLVSEAISSSYYKNRLYHVVEGSKGSPVAESTSQAITPNSSVAQYVRSKRQSLTGLFDYAFPDGCPSGKIGLISNVSGQKFDFIEVPWGEIHSSPMGRYLSQCTFDLSNDTLYLAPSYSKQYTPTYLANVRAGKFKVWFKVTRSGSTTANSRFVFDGQDTEHFKALRFKHATSTSGANEILDIDDGGLPTYYNYSNNANNAVNRANNTDPLWICVIVDPDDANGQIVREFESDTEAGLDTKIASNAYAMTSSEAIDIEGGQIGFASGYYYIYIDDLTVQTWDEDASAWVTQAVETFDVDANNYANDALTHDAAGNLTYDGQYAYTYDAWNRLVSVTRAYRDPTSGEIELGSVLSTSEYDGLNRRIVKTVTNSGGLDCTYHYYFRGQSVVEERNGSDLVLKQYVWAPPEGGGYIDELVQTAINGDPVNDPEFDPDDEDHDPRKYFALHNANYNVMAIVDDSGDLAERYEYTPYGERQVYFSSGGNDPLAMSPTMLSQRVDVDGVDQPYGLLAVGHQGLFHDEESGLVYNRARMLHPQLGRFVQRDPMGYVDGLNSYAAYHVLHSGVDPLGTDFIALADRPLDGPAGWSTPFQFFHYSLEYWFSDCPGPSTATTKDDYLDQYPDAWRIDSVELLCMTDYRYYGTLANGDPIVRDFGSVLSQNTFHGIAVISFGSSRATRFISVDDSFPTHTQSERIRLRDEWQRIRANATRYPYAEQMATRRQLLNWPRSYYEAWHTNSNVFALYMLTSAGLPLSSLPGWHPPGYARPSQNSFVVNIIGRPWHISSTPPPLPDFPGVQ